MDINKINWDFGGVSIVFVGFFCFCEVRIEGVLFDVSFISIVVGVFEICCEESI